MKITPIVLLSKTRRRSGKFMQFTTILQWSNDKRQESNCLATMHKTSSWTAVWGGLPLLDEGNRADADE